MRVLWHDICTWKPLNVYIGTWESFDVYICTWEYFDNFLLQCTAVGFWESLSSPVNVSRKVTSNLCLLNQNLLEMRGWGVHLENYFDKYISWQKFVPQNDQRIDWLEDIIWQNPQEGRCCGAIVPWRNQVLKRCFQYALQPLTYTIMVVNNLYSNFQIRFNVYIPLLAQRTGLLHSLHMWTQ